MTSELQDNKTSDIAYASKALRTVAFSAVLLAAIPHFFLEFPHLLLDAGQKRAWIGLTVWAPLALAATALLTDTSLLSRFERPKISIDVRIATAVLLPLAIVAVLVQLHFKVPFLGRPLGWEKSVVMAMAMYGSVQALNAIFWQGLIQHRIFNASSPAIRVVLVTLLSMVIWIPFTVSTGFADAAQTYLLDYGLIALAAAILFELGLTTRAVMFSRALMGIGYVWAYHNVFF